MKPKKFDDTLRAFLRTQPYVPVRVQLKEGRSFIIDDPDSVAFCNGAAAFIGSSGVQFFNCEHIGDMTQVNSEHAK